MSIRVRLTFGTLFLFALLLLSAGFGIVQLGRLSGDAEAILRDNYVTVRHVEAMQKALLRDDRSAFAEALRGQEANVTEPDELERTAALRGAFEDWGAAGATERMRTHLLEILELNLDAIDRKNTAARATADRARLWLWGIAALVLVVGLVFSLGFPRLVTQPILRLQHAVEAVADGNYRHRVPAFRSDELGALSEAFNSMAAKLEQWESSNLARLMNEKLRAEAVLNSLEDAGIGVGPDGTILFVNRKATELLGLSAGELTDRPVEEVAARNDLLRHVLGREGGGSFKAVVDGQEQHFTVVHVPIESPSGSLGTVHLLHNITPFLERDQAKTMFLATISHELKTPLASSDIGLGLLERDHGLSPAQQAILADLRKDHQRLVRIVSELLDLAQIESGRLKVEVAPHPLHPSVLEACAAVNALAQARDIILRNEVKADLPLVLHDPDRTVWVLVNVFNNAVRHAPPGSTIRIGSLVQVDRVELTITDEGPGIQGARRDRPFEPFGAGATGTGLGLSIAQRFMEAMQGSIAVEPMEPQGTRVRLRFRRG